MAGSAAGQGRKANNPPLDYMIIIIAVVAVIALALLLSSSHPKAKTETTVSTISVPAIASGNYTLVTSPTNTSLHSTTSIPAQPTNSSTKTSNSLLNQTSLNITMQNITFSTADVHYITQTQAANILGTGGTYNTSFTTNESDAVDFFPPIAMVTTYSNVSIIAGWTMNYTNTAACVTYCPTLYTLTYTTTNSRQIYKDLVLYSSSSANLTTINATVGGMEYSYGQIRLNDSWKGIFMYALEGNNVALLGLQTNQAVNQSQLIDTFANTIQ
jgi:hypothetical protein